MESFANILQKGGRPKRSERPCAAVIAAEFDGMGSMVTVQESALFPDYDGSKDLADWEDRPLFASEGICISW